MIEEGYKKQAYPVGIAGSLRILEGLCRVRVNSAGGPAGTHDGDIEAGVHIAPAAP